MALYYFFLTSVTMVNFSFPVIQNFIEKEKKEKKKGASFTTLSYPGCNSGS